jgi:uncharacterized membrane protein
MKAFVTITLLLALTGLPATVLAQDADGHSRSVDEVVTDILAEQRVAKTDDINCNQVTDDRFDELGDAVMEMMIGDSRQHEAMDNMMGGEGSESLRAMHIGMGQRYLGCASDDSGSFGMGQMGMMGGMMSMMGGAMNMTPLRQGFAGRSGLGMGMFSPWGMSGMGGGVGMLAFWIVVIVGIGFFVAWLSRQQNAGVKSKGALDILKERYAKGEINKEEFEDKKKGLST